MSRYEYKVVPSARKPRRAKGMKTNADRFANAMTEVINAEAAHGWEYLRSETLPMDERPGMFKKTIETYQTVMVFRREVDSLNETDLSKEAPKKPEARGVLRGLRGSSAARAAVPVVSAAKPAAPKALQGETNYWD